MTRDEAMKKLAEVVNAGGGCISERSIALSLDSYLALGMLKLDEPKSAEGLQEKISHTLCAAGFDHRGRSNIYRSLADAGLKIVSV